MKITYTTFEAARINGVDEATVRRQCANGKLAGAYKETVRERTIWRIPAEALFTDYTESDDDRAPFERERDAARAGEADTWISPFDIARAGEGE